MIKAKGKPKKIICLRDRLANELVKMQQQSAGLREQQTALKEQMRVLERGLDDTTVDTIMKDIRDLFKYHGFILDHALDEYFTTGTQRTVRHGISAKACGIGKNTRLSAGHHKGQSPTLKKILG